MSARYVPLQQTNEPFAWRPHAHECQCRFSILLAPPTHLRSSYFVPHTTPAQTATVQQYQPQNVKKNDYGSCPQRVENSSLKEREPAVSVKERHLIFQCSKPRFKASSHGNQRIPTHSYAFLNFLAFCNTKIICDLGGAPPGGVRGLARCQRRTKTRPLGRSKSRPVERVRLGACGPHVASTVQGALAVRPIL